MGFRGWASGFGGLGFDLFCGAFDSVEHAAEDEAVEGEDGVPVGEAEEAFGAEACGHLEIGGFVIRAGGGAGLVLIGWWRVDLEAEGGDAGEFHLGAEEERAVFLDADDAPEVECFAVFDVFGVASSSAEAGPADELVHPPADAPEGVGGVPAVPAADAADGTEDGGGGCVDADAAGVVEDGAAGPVGVAGDGAGRGPPRLNAV